MTLTNTGRVAREVDVTSYAELVLAPSSADFAHPAFSKLFVVTDYLEELGVIIATRRRRSLPAAATTTTGGFSVARFHRRRGRVT